MAGDNHATVRELRDLRRRRRLGDIEWFDVMYRVYLAALVGGAAVIIASDALGGLIDDEVPTADLLDRGPSIAGIAVAVAILVGLRSGAEGGPISIESADVRHVLLAPVDRRRVMLRPIGQRMRALAFGIAVVFAIIGQLVAREVEGSRGAWAASAAAYGAALALAYVAAATLAHACSMPRWLATTVGLVVLAWQGAAAVVGWDTTDDSTTPGPLDLHGSLLFWGIRQPAIDVVAIASIAIAMLAALAVGGRLRPEPLERRGQLVSQLRFAATIQDIRTVVLLRRQLQDEAPRRRPWGRAGPPPAATMRAKARAIPSSGPRARGNGGRALAPAVWRRGAASLRRLPASRLARLVGLAAAAGVCASLAVTTSPLFVLGLVGALFVLGLEALEPLAQEVDRPDLTASLPVERGWLFSHHLVAPAGLVAALALVGAVAATVVTPAHGTAAFALAVPVAWAGAIGSTVSTVRDAPEPPDIASTTLTGAERDVDRPFALPEFSGIGNVMTGLMPIVFSGIGAIPILAMRADPSASTAVRSTVGVAVCLGLLVGWIRRRDSWGRRVRHFFIAGRAA